MEKWSVQKSPGRGFKCGPKLSLSSVPSMVSCRNGKGFRNTEQALQIFHLEEKTVVISEVNKQTLTSVCPTAACLLPLD